MGFLDKLTKSGEKSKAAPASISRTKPHPKLMKSDVNSDEHWWNYPGRAPMDVPEFEGVDKEAIKADIAKRLAAGSLPIIEIPENLLKAIRLLDRSDFEYDTVAKLIERSPGLAGEVFKVINSSLMNRGHLIHDLRTALPRLGKVKIKSILYMYSAKMNLKGNTLFQDVVGDIVEHSYMVGIVSSYLSQRFFADPDAAFLSGLLHDIGKLAILKSISENFDLPKKLDFRVGEEFFAGIFPGLHEEAGVYIANHWKASDSVEAAILHHHDICIDGGEYQDPDMAEKLCFMTNVADTIARILGKGRAIGPVRLFNELAVVHMDWEQSWTTIDYLNAIPDMVNFKMD